MGTGAGLGSAAGVHSATGAWLGWPPVGLGVPEFMFGGGVRRVMRKTVLAADVLLGAFLVLQRVMRLYSLFGIPP